MSILRTRRGFPFRLARAPEALKEAVLRSSSLIRAAMRALVPVVGMPHLKAIALSWAPLKERGTWVVMYGYTVVWRFSWSCFEPRETRLELRFRGELDKAER